ncbi:hypothetical protein HPB51_019577 [Rhipicephalus microplus]|uniref:CCHC-type domain-containing protein n=1 Tax=Rhipicephalus microplus TaxID=6941 RepID=A0A9J6E3H4_RHIMP|nr:hypothetical protein HPB51_019577 [Rhipicephalus microplus]
MGPQLQDLTEGHVYNDLAELVKGANSLMWQAWHHFQYRPLTLPSNQVARNLVFRPSSVLNHHLLPQPTLLTYHWPLHPVALEPSYCRDWQHSCYTVSSFSPYGRAPTLLQEPTSGAMHVQCHRCGGFGHISRNCATGRRMGPLVCFQFCPRRRPKLLEPTQGGCTPVALGIRLVAVNDVSKVLDQMGCQLLQTAFFVRFDLCRDIVPGRDFLMVNGISQHVSFSGLTVDTEPQGIVPFVKKVPSLTFSHFSAHTFSHYC